MTNILTTAQAAEIAGNKTAETVRRWCVEGKIHAEIRGRAWAIDRKSFEAYLAQPEPESNLYTAREAAAYVRQRGVLADHRTVWLIARRHGIEPQPRPGSGGAMGITQEQADQLVKVYRPPRNVPTKSMPQRAPHKPGKSITINPDASRNRPRLAPQIGDVKTRARAAVLAHRREVKARMARTGESAFDASTAIRESW